MQFSNFPFKLEPQNFNDPNGTVKTVLPARDFYTEFKSVLPTIYQNSPNFMLRVKAITSTYQNLYDIIRSLVNVPNFIGTQSTSKNANCADVYLLMFARMLNVSFNINNFNSNQNTTIFIDDTEVKKNVAYKSILINTRGTHTDFEKYYVLRGIYDQFNNANVNQLVSRTAVFQSLFQDDPTNNTYELTNFIKDLAKIKAIGIRINEIAIINADQKFFTFGSNTNAYDPLNPVIIDFEEDLTTDRGNFATIDNNGLRQGAANFTKA
jgi:hypothetical protein